MSTSFLGTNLSGLEVMWAMLVILHDTEAMSFIENVPKSSRRGDRGYIMKNSRRNNQVGGRDDRHLRKQHQCVSMSCNTPCLPCASFMYIPRVMCSWE
jgi:hypothetical protein